MRKKSFRSGSDFPAEKVDEKVEWDDLVLDSRARSDLEEIGAWIEHSDRLSATRDSRKRRKRGCRVLFTGPSGTGKTLAASLLGRLASRDVYRIDLSSVASKYIGETEKNLARTFDRAEEERRILFFDEADALFGNRTDVKNASDRYANQEVSYLLQRMEMFGGVVILASNLDNDVDEALLRRFDSVIRFPKTKRG